MYLLTETKIVFRLMSNKQTPQPSPPASPSPLC